MTPRKVSHGLLSVTYLQCARHAHVPHAHHTPRPVLLFSPCVRTLYFLYCLPSLQHPSSPGACICPGLPPPVPAPGRERASACLPASGRTLHLRARVAWTLHIWLILLSTPSGCGSRIPVAVSVSVLPLPVLTHSAAPCPAGSSQTRFRANARAQTGQSSGAGVYSPTLVARTRWHRGGWGVVPLSGGTAFR